MVLFDQPQKIYNLGEKDCRLALHQQQSVITKKGQKGVYFVAPENGENVTVVACTNATGETISFMIIFKGKSRRENFGNSLPAFACLKMAEKAA